MKNGRSRKALALLLAGCLALLTGCSGQTAEENTPLQTLAPASVGYSAPDGDNMPERTVTHQLYLPGSSDLHLVPRETRLSVSDLNDEVLQLVLALLAYESDAEVTHLGGEWQLSLYGTDPLEYSDGICTINLGTSALQMSHRDFYKTCVAIATTLCDLDSISFVNVLVADQSVGLDITGNLAMGSLTGHPEENLPVLWEQMEAKRTPLGDDLSKTPLSSLATLYFPLPDARGIGCENRILNFDGQTPQQLAAGLLKELDQLIRENAGAEEETPGLLDSLLHDPVISELEDGGRLITLSFREETSAWMLGMGTDMPCMLAAVTSTMTTFIPGIAAISVRIGDKPITELHSATFGGMTVLGGLLRRNMFVDYLMGSTTVFFARGGKLCRCDQPVNRRMTDIPRAQLNALLAGPAPLQRQEGIAATMPENVREEDILGISVENDTLLINLSENFRTEILTGGAEKEALLCYSMVNTLCENSGLKKVCFFFEGAQEETIAGEIYWAGVFCYNPGLSESDRG